MKIGEPQMNDIKGYDYHLKSLNDIFQVLKENDILDIRNYIGKPIIVCIPQQVVGRWQTHANVCFSAILDCFLFEEEYSDDGCLEYIIDAQLSSFPQKEFIQILSKGEDNLKFEEEAGEFLVESLKIIVSDLDDCAGVDFSVEGLFSIQDWDLSIKERLRGWLDCFIYPA